MYTKRLQPAYSVIVFRRLWPHRAEGMAAKVPALVSDIDGPMELIGNNEYGFCFECGNAVSLAEQIRYIIANYSSDSIRQMIDNAYTHVRENFEIKAIAKKYIDTY
jgi:glycosyltransferase involved in cell wall biosynthesis